MGLELLWLVVAIAATIVVVGAIMESLRSHRRSLILLLKLSHTAKGSRNPSCAKGEPLFWASKLGRVGLSFEPTWLVGWRADRTKPRPDERQA
ncbi:hypothetical protein V6N11_036853 [Hibiscus sabdariffa]|uniref:Secreted protein n=1 Tax=Hibiscus sabdariffa TaxID=183260 RepID=A0ABR2RCD2_9ROSI